MVPTVEWSWVWNGMEWIQWIKWNGSLDGMEWNGGNGMEWNGMEWNGSTDQQIWNPRVSQERPSETWRPFLARSRWVFKPVKRPWTECNTRDFRQMRHAGSQIIR